MSQAWDEIEPLLKKINVTDYSQRDDSNRTSENAKRGVRRALLALEAKADEREDLRSMLLDQGRENARLSLDVERLSIQLAAAIRAALTQPATPDTDTTEESA